MSNNTITQIIEADQVGEKLGTITVTASLVAHNGDGFLPDDEFGQPYHAFQFDFADAEGADDGVTFAVALEASMTLMEHVTTNLCANYSKEFESDLPAEDYAQITAATQSAMRDIIHSTYETIVDVLNQQSEVLQAGKLYFQRNPVDTTAEPDPTSVELDITTEE